MIKDFPLTKKLLSNFFRIAAFSGLSLMVLSGCGEKVQPTSKDGKTIVRLGYFPNVTHAQPLIGVPRGDYQKAVGDQIQLDSRTFNAGPSVIEAIFAGELDIAYIGPSPTLNGFIKSKGEEVRVVAGAASNGTLIVANKNSGITKLEELRGKRVATPQLGNTQDIAARDYLINVLGVTLKDRGGDTEIIPLANPSIETSFVKGELDAAWVPEPWGSRLIDKGEGILIAEEKDLWPNKTFLLTNIIARKKFLEENPEVVVNLLKAHVQISKELQDNPVLFEKAVQEELKRLTSQELPLSVISGAFKYTQFTWDTHPETFQGFFEKAKKLKFITDDKLDLGKLIDSSFLDKALQSSSNQPATAN